MLAIYSEKESPRLQYTLELIFSDLLGIDFRLYTDKEKFLATDMPKLSYSAQPTGDEINIKPAGLLFEDSLLRQDLKTDDWNGIKVFYYHGDNGAAFPFDPLAMSFHLVSRYEEYLDNWEPDRHGRFRPEASILQKTGMLKRPLVNIITLKIREELQKRYPDLKFPEKPYVFTPTYDIDMAYAHIGKGFMRAVGGFAKLFIKLQPGQVRERIRTLMGMEQDPFDNFTFQQQLHDQYKLKPLYFVNLGDYSKFDKNISHEREELRTLLRRLNETAGVGMHPSYYSDQKFGAFEEEKKRLEDILGHEVKQSRQHFLKLKFPDTYRTLIRHGIEEDYSMGYASCTGYRAGICSPFYFYDLEKEEKTGLKIFPFAFMDTVFLDYQGTAAANVPGILKPLILEAKQYRGHLIGIWHNYALADIEERLKSYSEVVKMASVQDVL